MTKLYNRDVEITIGSRSNLVDSVSFGVDFDIDFSVNMTASGKDPNTANVKIYNANVQDHDLFIFDFDDLYLQINAGYNNITGTLYSGDITYMNEYKENVNWVLEIVAGDGQKAAKDNIIQLSYKPDVSAKKIVNDIIDTMKNAGNIVVSSISETALSALAKKKEKAGRTISESAGDALEKMLDKFSYKYTIQNNELIIYAVDDAIETDAIYLSEETGLINSPAIKRIEKGRKGKKTVTNGVEFDCLIQPNIKPGCTVEIDSINDSCSDQYVVQDVTVSGTTKDSNYHMRVFAL